MCCPHSPFSESEAGEKSHHLGSEGLGGEKWSLCCLQDSLSPIFRDQAEEMVTNKTGFLHFLLLSNKPQTVQTPNHFHWCQATANNPDDSLSCLSARCYCINHTVTQPWIVHGWIGWAILLHRSRVHHTWNSPSLIRNRAFSKAMSQY